MKLDRTGYRQDRYLTVFHIDTTKDSELHPMYEYMKKRGWGGEIAGDCEDGSICYVVNTMDIDDFKRDYKEGKIEIRNTRKN